MSMRENSFAVLCRLPAVSISLVAVLAVIGCTFEKGFSEVKAETLLLSGEWHVEDIDQRGVIDRAMVTMQFEVDDRIAGSTGCNRYNGMLESANGAFVVSKTITTRMACVQAVADQEQRFLNALNDAVRYEIEADKWLVIYDAADHPRLKAIQMQPRIQQQDMIMDGASSQTTTYQCDNRGKVTTRFLGPETIEITLAHRTLILQARRSASGAQYTGEDVTFWNKGDEALLIESGVKSHCTRQAPE